MTPPSDNHVHSEWSWDAFDGSMERTCGRAVELGLPSVAFTEHADFMPWPLGPDERIPVQWEPLVNEDSILIPPVFDTVGYLAAIEKCRERFPGLRIRSGVELSEPHMFPDQTAALLDGGGFERILASVHSAAYLEGYVEVSDAYKHRGTATVIRDYLSETARMIEAFDGFQVLAHIDYPVRYWPARAGPHDPHDFEDEYRHVLRTLAKAGKVLEVNTKVPLDAAVVRWWRAEGGAAITFASDAHEPSALARGFADAADMAESCGFHPTGDPQGFWCRTRPL